MLDARFPEHEQLPRLMRALIRTEDGRARTTINGEPFGSPLTDNHWRDDGYRYHDIFHIAHATFLGWSPTLRGLLGRKRRSDPRVDEIEDGGRAIVIEEGLTAFVFAYAETQQFFEGADTLDSPGDQTMIRAVRLMTQHLEVRARTPADWERAILQGYAAWREIRTWQGGEVTADLSRQTLTVNRPT